ncbi:MAG: hypothetical protein R3C15_17680 [Thermoleophilia bacterium]
MPPLPEPGAPSAESVVRARFAARAREEVLALVDEALVAEHAANPFGRHSDALDRVLVQLRARAIAGKEVILQDAGGGYRLGRLGARRGDAPTPIDGPSYATVPEAEHAVFLLRLEELSR